MRRAPSTPAEIDLASFVHNHTGGGLSVGAVRLAVAAAFRAAGLESPELDARVLIGHALGLDHAALVAASKSPLGTEEAERVITLATRRLMHEPVARIIGVKEFWSLTLHVTAATLVPRPETETVVEAALAAIDARHARLHPLRIADLGTGSGALLLALLSELPNARGVGADVSVAALAVARQNAWRLGISRADFVACDIAAALRGPFDLIVSNPPYIASDEIALLAPDVRDHDPHDALDGGPDGLAFYRVIAPAARSLLGRSGELVVEIGNGQAESVGSLITAAGLVLSARRNDLLGIPRALSARVPA